MGSLFDLYRLFAGTVAANLVMFMVIIKTYGEPFSLLTDPFSWLGKLVTSDGLANGSAYFFSATLLMDALIWRKAVELIKAYRTGRHPGVRLLGRIVFTGFILMAFPCDRFVYTHSLGGGLAVGGIWALTTWMIYAGRDKFSPNFYLFLNLALHIAALYCAVNFVLDSRLKGFSQRPLISVVTAEAGLCLFTLARERAGSEVACPAASEPGA